MLATTHHSRQDSNRSGKNDRRNIEIPVINVSHLNADTGHRLLDAAVRYGFVYVDTHGTDFTPDVVQRQFELSMRFFNSPLEEKSACPVGPTGEGWAAVHSENLDPAHHKRGDFKESFNLHEFVDGLPQQPIPKSLHGHENQLRDFEDRCRTTCHRLLRLLALGLEVSDPEWFSSRHTSPSFSTLRYLFYPALPKSVDSQSDTDVRAGAHSDYGSISLLFQRPGEPGLEILASDQRWSTVPVIPAGYEPQVLSHDDAEDKVDTPLPPILVNIGDLLSYWTNGLLKSTVHRVVIPRDASYSTHSQGDISPPKASPRASSDTNATESRSRTGPDFNPSFGEPAKARYSIVYFCHPADDTTLEAVPSETVSQHEILDQVGYGGGADYQPSREQNKGTLLTAKEYGVWRVKATYN